DDAGVPGGPRSVLVDVDRVLVAQGVHPVVNHRLIHRVSGLAGPAGAGRLDLVDTGLQVRAPRGTLGTLSPAAAIISRITSLTPPPKVMTKFRLVILSSQSSTAAVWASAGLP